ncbi:hypothetical protein GUJ93_ZPchr0006g44463 [Zizania palustris]|uniref:LysM domain-containing protein n=1 Tax=Zizania palustris TaxID=103762 RepID=A0A8J5SVB7_ZIZPA|nr:hypothetical protein GUJ93_ZPchr0006g44463 [Zizania palustris]
MRKSAIVYTAPNATTYGELVARFNTTTLLGLLGANNLPDSTSSTKAIPAKSTVRIPFPCLCANNNVGQSDRHPIYVVQPEDGLDHIAREVFNAFVTYQEIAAANNISDPNKILIGQTLWIPLPCSCDKVDDSDVMHLAYSVASGESTSGIAAKYGVSEPTLLRINEISDPKKLLQGQILDVPLPGPDAQGDIHLSVENPNCLKWWEKSDWTGYKELGAEKSGKSGEGDSWWEKWKEVLYQDEWSNLARIERSAEKQAKSGAENAGWYEKWCELYQTYASFSTLLGLLGANNLPDSTSSTKAIPAKSTVRIPFPCRCANNNVGQSDSHPIYVVQPEDGLDHIAHDDPLL